MASIGELFIELGVKADTQKIDKIGQGFKSLRTNLLLTAGAFTGAIVGLDRFINSALKGVVSLQNLQNQTGLSIEKIQEFQQAGQLSNLAISAEQIAQSIGNVQKNIAKIRIGQGDIAPFQLLGVEVQGQDAFGVIDQLRDSIKGLDPAIATNLISGIGLTPDFINILKLTRTEFEALSQNTFLNPKQRANIDRVGTSIKALTLRFKALKDQAIAKIAPELDKLVQKFFKWLKDNGEKIISTISGIARAFARFAQAIGNAFDLATRFLGSINGMQNGVKILAASFAFLTLSFSPFLAGLVAIILLLDDIAVFRAGGDSVIGELVKAFNDLPDFGKILGGGAIVGILASITAGLVAMTAPAIALAAPLVAISGALAAVINAPKLGRLGGEKLNEFSVVRNVMDALFSAGSGIRDFIDVNKEAFKPGSFRKDSATTINNNVTVNGVQEPKAVGEETQRALRTLTQEDLNRTEASQGNGVR